MPIVGFIAIIWILRALASSNISGARIFSNSPLETSSPVITVGLKIIVFFLASCAASAWGHTSLSLLVLALGILALMPTLFLNCVVVPLGLPRIAYWYSRCAWPNGFGGEFRLGAVYYSALALARKGANAERVAWLRQRLSVESSAHVAYDMTLGLLLALSGDAATARRIFAAFDDDHKRLGMWCFRRAARDWLVMDAARRGDWPEVIARGRRGADSYRWSYAVARIAERLDRHPQAPGNRQLWALWLCAPRRLKLLPFVRRAIAVPWTAEEDDSSPPFPKDLAGALSNLAGMLMQTARTGMEPAREEFLSTVRWVNIRLESPLLHNQIQQRLQALGSFSPSGADVAVNSFREQFAALITPLIEQSPHLVTGERERPVIKEVIGKIRQDAFQDIEARCRDYVNRTANEISFDIEEEWKAWEKLRAIADRLLIIAPDAEDTLFREVYAPICNFGVFQHNAESRHRLAYDMFLWLSWHAHSNPAAAQLLERNLGNPSDFEQHRFSRIWNPIERILKFWEWDRSVKVAVLVIAFLAFIIKACSIVPSSSPVPQTIPQVSIPQQNLLQPPPAAPEPAVTVNPAPSVGPVLPPLPPRASPEADLPQPRHGGQVLGTRRKNYEVVVKGRTVTVYMTEQDLNYDLEGATGDVSYRVRQPPMIRRFDLVPIGKDRMRVTIEDAPFEPGDILWVHIYPKEHAESSLQVEVPDPAK